MPLVYHTCAVLSTSMFVFRRGSLAEGEVRVRAFYPRITRGDVKFWDAARCPGRRS